MNSKDARSLRVLVWLCIFPMFGEASWDHAIIDVH